MSDKAVDSQSVKREKKKRKKMGEREKNNNQQAISGNDRRQVFFHQLECSRNNLDIIRMNVEVDKSPAKRDNRPESGGG